MAPLAGIQSRRICSDLRTRADDRSPENTTTREYSHFRPLSRIARKPESTWADDCLGRDIICDIDSPPIRNRQHTSVVTERCPISAPVRHGTNERTLRGVPKVQR